ncbi:hypothetical protein Q7526_07525 [Glaesserella parasuis]|nr:hypothetical protein [Glaesserella parasuis]MDP0342056.1 hypothetical protein [Glaesserella parasuis]MDP0357873.1 hypothetical protein [Glaesserella parasuis]
MQKEIVRKSSPTMLPNITRVGENGDNIIIEFGFEVTDGEFEIFSSICLDKESAEKLKKQIEIVFK